MKTLRLFIPLLLLLACNETPDNRDAPEGLPQPAHTDPQLRSYHNSANGFTLLYPAAWDTSLLSSQMIFTATDRTDSMNVFRENLNIYKVSVARDATLDMVLKSAGNGFLTEYQNGIILENTIRKNAAALDYAMLRTSIYRKRVKIITSNVYFKKADNVYVLTLGMDGKDSSRFAKVYADIIDGFRFD